MPEWFWFAFAFGLVLAVCGYVLWHEFREAPTRDDWPHDDDRLGG